MNTIALKATNYTFPVERFIIIYKVYLTFESERNLKVLPLKGKLQISFGAVYYDVQGRSIL